jgi:hypothetical protein
MACRATGCAGAACWPVSSVAPRSRRAVRPSYGPRCGGPIAVVGPNERLFFLLGGGGGGSGAVPSLVASCAPLLTPFCASRASFLTPFCTPRSPFLTPLGTRLRRICGRRRRRGGCRGGLGFSLGHRQKRRRSDQPKYSRASKECERAATTDLFRLRTFTHFQAPGLLPHQSMSLTSAAYLLIWINLAGWFKPRWDFGRWDRHSRQVRDDGPRSDDQSLAEFGSRKILGRYFGFKGLG